MNAFLLVSLRPDGLVGEVLGLFATPAAAERALLADNWEPPVTSTVWGYPSRPWRKAGMLNRAVVEMEVTP